MTTSDRPSTVSVPEQDDDTNQKFRWERYLRNACPCQLPNPARLAAYVLATHMNEFGECYITVARLAKGMGAQERWARKAKKQLVELGWVGILNPGERRSDGGFMRSEFRALFPAQEVCAKCLGVSTELDSQVGTIEPQGRHDRTPTPGSIEPLPRFYSADLTGSIDPYRTNTREQTLEQTLEQTTERITEVPRSLRSRGISSSHFSISARRGKEAARQAHLEDIEKSPTPEVRETLEQSPSLGQLWQKRNDRLSRLPA